MDELVTIQASEYEKLAKSAVEGVRRLRLTIAMMWQALDAIRKVKTWDEFMALGPSVLAVMDQAEIGGIHKTHDEIKARADKAEAEAAELRGKLETAQQYKPAWEDYMAHVDRASRELKGPHLGKNWLQAALDEAAELRGKLEEAGRIGKALAEEAQNGVRLLAEAQRQSEVYRAKIAELEQLVADMHAAAMGEVCGPKRGVVEDIADLRRESEVRLHNFNGLYRRWKEVHSGLEKLMAEVDSEMSVRFSPWPDWFCEEYACKGAYQAFRAEIVSRIEAILHGGGDEPID